jgi:penicillin amidase
MMWQLSHAWYSELVRSDIIQMVGQEHAAELEINYPTLNPICLPSGIEFNSINFEGTLSRADGPFLKQGLGSNAWSVAGAKSDTGAAYLCNDMHLPLGAPALWYGIHLIAGKLNVTGASLPGLPLVLVGHNAHIAWGMTLAFTDCEDLFIEQFDPQNPKQYLFKDQWHDADVISEPIQVKGRKEPHIEQVTLTQHGPIISDVVGYPDQRIAINSMALRPCLAIQGWQLLNHSHNWDEFVGALQLIDAPQLSVAYADLQGNIGYWVTGKVPIRAKGDGRLPVPGWTGEYEWVGEVPFEEMPHALNPESGYIVTCNHRITPDDYPHYLGEVWMNGYRARRITGYFESKDRLTTSDFQKMQGDFTCLPGKEFVSHITDLDSADPDIILAVEKLRDWDGQLTSNSIAGAIYEVTRYHVVRNLLEPSLGDKLTLEFMGQGFHPVLLTSNEFYGHDTVAMLRMLDNPDSWWIKEAGGKERVLKSSLKQAVQWLRSNLGNQSNDWQWGKIHGAVFPHPMGLQKPLDQVFNRGPFPIGGDTDTPCQTAFHSYDPYDNKAWAPSFRQIVNMDDLSRSLTIIPPGQSGQLANQHYDDLIAPWLEGEYHPMLWTREQIEANTEGILILNGSE